MQAPFRGNCVLRHIRRLSIIQNSIRAGATRRFNGLEGIFHCHA